MTSWEDEKGYAHPLMRCPFCGAEAAMMISQATLWESEEDITDRYTVVCDIYKNGCGATCGFHSTKTKAASSWNTRW